MMPTNGQSRIRQRDVEDHITVCTRDRWTACGLVVISILTGACKESTGPDPKAQVASPALPPFDVDGVVANVRSAFRSFEGAWFSHQPSMTVRVTTSGAFVEMPEISSTGAAFDIRRPRFSRHGWDCAASGSPFQSNGRGGVSSDACGTIETFAPLPRGVEQSWTFEHRPHGIGDLEVRIEMPELDLGAIDEGGLLLRHRTEGIALRYGTSTWIDARNHKTTLAMRWERGVVVISVPADVLDNSRYPAVLDPIITTENGIDEAVYVPVDGYQALPAIAFDGNQYLVVWEDYHHYKGAPNDTDIYGTRVTTSGQVLDPLGIRVSTAPNNQMAPTVAFGGDVFLVAWSDERNGVGAGDIVGARVSAGGVVLDPNGFSISAVGGAQSNPALAFLSSTQAFAAAWADRRSGTSSDVYVARISIAGVVLDAPLGLSTLSGPGDQDRPALSCLEDTCMVVSEDRNGADSNIVARRVDASGTLLGPGTISVSSAVRRQTTPSVANDGSNYFVVWTDERNASTSPGPGDIYGARVSSGGAVLDPLGVSISQLAEDERFPSVVGDDTQYLVVWQRDVGQPNRYDVLAHRRTLAGAPIGAAPLTLAANVLARPELAPPRGYPIVPRAIFGGTNFFVLWADRTGYYDDVYGVRLSTAGAILDASALLVSKQPNDQRAPRIAFNGTRYLAVWEDRRDPEPPQVPELYGALLSSTGSVLDPNGRLIATTKDSITPSSPESIRCPDVASNGVDFLVVWQRAGGSPTSVLATRVAAASGAVLDPAGIPIASGSTSCPAVTFDGSNYVIATGLGTSSLRIVRVSSVGGIVGVSTVPTSGNTLVHSGGAASTGSGALIAWSSLNGLTYDVFAARTNSAGVLLDPTGFAVSTGVGHRYYARAAAGGGQYLVVWQDERNGSTNPDIVGTRITSAGSVLDASGVPIATAAGPQINPSVSWVSQAFVVNWTDDTNSPNSDVHAARVAPAGTLLDGVSFTLTTGPAAEDAATIISSANGAIALYEGRATRIYRDPEASRIRSRRISWNSSGESCAVASDCTTGFCVDGVCCNEACGGGTSNDCRACSVTAGAVVDGTCGAVSAGTTCRPAAGTCDQVETCNGVGLDCPFDVLSGPGVVCRASSGTCDLAETCNGSSPLCPTDAFAPSSQVCRASTGPCDLAETCSGSNAVCPGNNFLPSSTICRASAGPCDIPEMCSGVGAGCPADALRPSGFQCRASAGSCDPAEQCTGASVICPGDILSAASVVCRASAGPCDVEERCTGNEPSCPTDAFVLSQTPCRTSAGPCDANEYCSGSSSACPVDVYRPAGSECRASAGPCDPAETCSGSSVACPADARRPPGSVCRASVGSCDVAEVCDGVLPGCSEDVMVAIGTECRSAAGPCDRPEVCDGQAGTCPADVFQLSGAVCRPASSVCDLEERCSGNSIDCPADEKYPLGTSCDDENPCTVDDQCDAETCAGRVVECSEKPTCQSGTCCGEVGLPCDDGDPCTADECGSTGECLYRAIHTGDCSPDAGVLDTGGASDGAVLDGEVLIDAGELDVGDGDAGELDAETSVSDAEVVVRDGDVLGLDAEAASPEVETVGDAGAGVAGCSTDEQCKGDRVCDPETRSCVSPPSGCACGQVERRSTEPYGWLLLVALLMCSVARHRWGSVAGHRPS